MLSRLLFLICSVLLAAGCAQRPQIELEIVRAEVARAYAHGAKILAESDYIAASTALHEAEVLSFQGDYGRAREVLNQALLRAAKATDLAQQKAGELNARRQRELETLAAIEKNKTIEAAKKVVIIAPPQLKPLRTEPVKPKIVLLDRVTVSVGETLFSLASRNDIYGEPLLWPLIYKANRDQIKDPKQIYEGQVLSVPRDKSLQEQEAARQEAREANLFPR